MTEFRPITALRGLAAVTVLIGHVFSPYLGDRTPPLLERFQVGVDLFFYISGFVIAHVYQAQFATQLRAGPVGSFLWARIARIYPMQLFATLTMLPHLGAGDLFTGTSLVYNLLLLQSPWLPDSTWYIFSWSVSAEWHAYLVFPLAAFALAKCRRWSKTAIAAGLCAILFVLMSDPANSNISHGPGALLRVLPEFVLGMLAYDYYRSGAWSDFWRHDLTFLSILGLLAFCLQFLPSIFYALALMPALLLASVHNDGALSKLLHGRLWNGLGRISYSMYMVQGLALSIGMLLASLTDLPRLAQYGLLVLTCLLDVFIGAAAYRCIETPSRDFLKGLAARARGVTAPPAALAKRAD